VGCTYKKGNASLARSQTFQKKKKTRRRKSNTVSGQADSPEKGVDKTEGVFGKKERRTPSSPGRERISTCPRGETTSIQEEAFASEKRESCNSFNKRVAPESFPDGGRIR